MNIRREDVLKLSVAERVQLVEEIGDSLLESPDVLPISGAQRRELDLRLDAYERDPSKTTPWPQVRDRLGPSVGRIASYGTLKEAAARRRGQ